MSQSAELSRKQIEAELTMDDLKSVWDFFCKKLGDYASSLQLEDVVNLNINKSKVIMGMVDYAEHHCNLSELTESIKEQKPDFFDYKESIFHELPKIPPEIMESQEEINPKMLREEMHKIFNMEDFKRIWPFFMGYYKASLSQAEAYNPNSPEFSLEQYAKQNNISFKLQN